MTEQDVISLFVSALKRTYEASLIRDELTIGI